MEAVVFDGSTLELKYEKNWPIPKIENDTDVIIKVQYAGVCGTDVHIVLGEFPANKERRIPLGHESSGIVHEVGSKSIFKKGQRVVYDPSRPCNLCNFCRKGKYHYCSKDGLYSLIGIYRDGGWAQYIKVPEEEVYLLPEEVTLKQAALTEPFSCVSHGFDRASPILVGDKILIVGAGIIGNLWLSALHHHGHRDVTVSEMNQKRLDIVKGLDTGFRLVTPDVLTNEDTEYDVIIDCTGVAKVMEMSFNYLKPGGKYVLFGCCPPNQKALVTPFDVFDKELTLIGVKVSCFSFPNAIAWLSAMGSRYLDFDKLGVKTYALSEYEQVLKDLKNGVIAKAVFKID